MSKRGIQSLESSPRGSTRFHRFIGLSLSGGKSDKACLAVLDYYPEHKKVFLSSLSEKIKSDEKISADLKIHEALTQYNQNVETVALDVPITLPKCMTCRLTCPGYEMCSEPEIKWMWQANEKRNKKRKPKKLFTPYTQRPVELYLAQELEEPFNLAHALGANTAPLTARAHFIMRRESFQFLEVHPRLSVWRIGRSLKVAKSHLRFHRHAVGGDESRHIILNALSHHGVAFLYHQDVKQMVENNHAFEAFICALTAYLKFVHQTEPRPQDFPPEEGWIEFPIKEIQW